MRSCCHPLTLLCGALLLPCAVLAGDPAERGRAPVDRYAVADLANLQNFALDQDATGAIWVGNGTHLLRHDGARMTALATEPPARYLRDVQAFADGRVFVTAEAQLGWFQPDGAGGWTFRSETARLPPPDPANAVERYQAFVHVDDAFWIKTDRRYLMLPARGPALAWNSGEGRRPFLVAGRVWVASEQRGLLTLRRHDGQIVAEPLAGGTQFIGRPVIAVADLGAAGVVLAGRRGDVWRWRDGQIEALADANTRAALAERGIQCALALRDGGYALGFLRGGVAVYAADGRLRETHAGADIGGATVHALHEDRDGGLWLAQDHALRRIDRGSGVTVFDHDAGINNARRLLRHQGRLYAAGASGLYRLVPATPGRAARFELLTPDIAVALDATSTGRSLLVASGRLKRLRLDPAGRVAALETLAARTGVVSVVRRSMWHANRVYAAGEGFVLVLDEVESAAPRWRRIEGLRGRAESMVETDARTLWIGAARHGLWRLTLGDGGGADTLTAFGPDRGRPADHPLQVLPGRHGPWFAGPDGVRRLAADGEHLVPADLPAPGLVPGAAFFRLIEDSAGNLWARPQDGFGVFWRTPAGYRWEDRMLGALSAAPTVHDVLREDDTVWLARADGVLRLALGDRQAAARPLPPQLTAVLDLRADRRLPLTAAALPAQRRDALFRWALPSHLRAGAVQYRARLDGYDPEWSEWSDASERRYTNLPDGPLTLALEARDALGRVSRAAPLVLTVATPWWRSSPAWATYAGLALGSLAMAAWAADRRRRRLAAWRERRLEDQVAARTAELAERNAQLKWQAARLQEVDALKSRFFGNVSHEFRTPLSLVLGPLDDLLSDPRQRLSAPLRETLELARRNARRMRDLTTELLDLHRLEQGQLPLKRQMSDLGAFLRQCADSQAALVERHAHHWSGDAPEAAALALFDPVQVERCFANLVSNAVKYTPAGGRLHWQLTLGDSEARIAVSDNGPGIAAPDLTRVYERFWRSAAGADTDGVGIGLALVREIITLHGGRVGADSTPGAGSCFWFTLPLAPAEAPTPMPAAGDSTPSAAAEPVSAAPLMLVIDDQPDLCRRLQQLFSPRFRVLAVADGETALRHARQTAPDVIVSDVLMPGLDGMTLTRRLRAEPATAAVPVLLLTARADTADAVAGLAAGADDYLTKPFDSAELQARIDALLAVRRRLREQWQAADAAPSAAPPSDRWRQRFDAVLAAHLADSGFSIDDWALALHTDRSTLFRQARARLGMSPSTYLREARLRHADALLASGAVAVSAVAAAVGFESTSSFARAFRQHFGRSPSARRATAPATATVHSGVQPAVGT